VGSTGTIPRQTLKANMTPDPIEPTQPTTRIPNFLHLLLLLAFTVLAFFLCEGIVIAFHPHRINQVIADQRLQLFANIGVYAVAAALAAAIFPLIWRRPFAAGISWNLHRASLGLVPLGIGLGFASQAVSGLLPIPKKMPIEDVFKTPGIIWILTLFGIFIAPAFEELVFRGFLLPALAIAADYFTLPRTADREQDLATLHRWRTSDTFSTNSLVFASVVTSLAFAAIHAPQLGYAWPAVALLWTVSMVLCYLRIRTQSLAASTIVHASYNACIFIAVFFATGGYRHLDKL
jgi:membrane protease YdiL (CAAX protease family)